jgi:peptide/nickel transport system ATP-binding protein
MAITRLLPSRGVRVTGSVKMDGVDLLALPESEMRARRGRDISMVFQDPLSSLNPVIPIGLQVTEVLARHRGMRKEAARTEAADLLDRVGIPDPRRRLDSYPHQLSAACGSARSSPSRWPAGPGCSSPTSPRPRSTSPSRPRSWSCSRRWWPRPAPRLIMITHDLGVVAGLCETVNVLYAGRIVERAQRHRLFGTPRHPYTHGLLRSIPRLDAPGRRRAGRDPGSVVDNGAVDARLALFAPR